MLVFTRRVEERIRIGDEISVCIVASWGQVRVGIEAPKALPVHREEVYQELLRKPGGPPTIHRQRMDKARKQVKAEQEVVQAAIAWKEAFFSGEPQGTHRRMQAASHRLRVAVDNHVFTGR